MRTNKFKVQTSAGKTVDSVVWYSEGILLVKFLYRSVTINSEQCVQTLKKLKQQIQKIQAKR
jgi:Transposase.